MSSPDSERVVRYVDALCEALELEMQRDESVFLYGLDVDDHLGIQGSTKGLVDKFGPDRVFTTPLSEDAMTGMGVGAAMAGARPVHVHIRMDFLLLCMNQLVNIAAKARYMWGGQVKVPLVVRSIIGKSWGQGAQHSQGLHSLFMHIPGLKVVAPTNAYDAKGCLIAAIRDDNPVIFVEHRLLYNTDAAVPTETYTVPLGKARITRHGSDITIVGISNMQLEAVRAAELLTDEGVSAEVIDPITLVPLDIDAIAASVERTGHLLVVDNGWTMCGASAEICAQIAERLPGTRMARVGFAPTTCPTTPWLEKAFYPNPGSIAAAAWKLVRPGEKDMPTPTQERIELAYQTSFRGPF